MNMIRAPIDQIFTRNSRTEGRTLVLEHAFIDRELENDTECECRPCFGGFMSTQIFNFCVGGIKAMAKTQRSERIPYIESTKLKRRR
jgi:hypothetical protein